MGSIASLAGNTADATRYNVSCKMLESWYVLVHVLTFRASVPQTLAKEYSTQIVSSAMASTNDHLKLTYDSDDSSWSQLYNLLPDKLYDLGLFDADFYQMQAVWYARQACEHSFCPCPEEASADAPFAPFAVPYGVPLDSQSDGSKTDFSLWMAGIYHDNSTMRDIFIEGVYDYLVFGSSGQAVPDYYSANNATQIGGFVNR